jgi:chromosome segregation ATPase
VATETWLVPTVTALLGGGLFGGLSQILHARNTGKQIKIDAEKAPADIEAVLLGGASQAVQVLTNSLTWTQGEMKALKEEQAADKARIRALMDSNDSKDTRIKEMERELQMLRLQVAEVQAALDRATLRIQEMRGHTNGQDT